MWNDGIRGKNFQKLGGELRLISPSEWHFLEFQTKIDGDATLSKYGLRFENIFYSSNWLRNCRLDRKNYHWEDGQQLMFKYSNWDRRYIWMIDPITNSIQLLKGYKYHKNDVLTDFLVSGLGENGYDPFRISKNLFNYVKDGIEETSTDKWQNLIIMEKVKQNLDNESHFKYGRRKKKKRSAPNPKNHITNSTNPENRQPDEVVDIESENFENDSNEEDLNPEFSELSSLLSNESMLEFMKKSLYLPDRGKKDQIQDNEK